MRSLNVLLFAAALFFAVACNTDEPSEQVTEPAALEQEDDKASAGEAVAGNDEPESEQRAPRSMADPERRKAMAERMEAMRERGMDRGDRASHREAMRKRAEAGEARERLRARRGARAEAWWKDEALAGRLNLSQEQGQRLDEARESVDASLTDSRRQLVQVNEQLGQALEARDRSQLETLLEQRHDAAAARAQAEARWARELLDVLSDEQLERLAEERPAQLMRMLSPR